MNHLKIIMLAVLIVANFVGAMEQAHPTDFSVRDGWSKNVKYSLETYKNFRDYDQDITYIKWVGLDGTVVAIEIANDLYRRDEKLHNKLKSLSKYYDGIGRYRCFDERHLADFIAVLSEEKLLPNFIINRMIYVLNINNVSFCGES